MRPRPRSGIRADTARTRTVRRRCLTPASRAISMSLCLVARVAVQVRRVAELRRVDEEAHHDGLAALAGGREQRQMTAVQRTHGGYKPDRAVAVSERLRERPPPLARRSCRRSSGLSLTCGEGRERVVRRKEIGRRVGDRRAVPLHGLPVASLDRACSAESRCRSRAASGGRAPPTGRPSPRGDRRQRAAA